MSKTLTHCRTSAAVLVALTIILSWNLMSDAAEIVLRRQVTLLGPVVRLGDVADLSASNDARLQELITTPLLPAPAPGTRKYLRAAQLRDLLRAQGISLADLTFRGAPRVAILTRSVSLRKTSSNPTAASLSGSAAYPTRSRHLPRNQVLRKSAPSGQAEKSRSAEQQAIEPVQQVVVTVRPVERGMLVRADDIEILNQEGRVPFRAIQSLDQALGKIAKQSLRSGVLLLENHLQAPRLVERGETVTVFARTAGIQVRTHAVAKQHGSLGALVQVETTDRRDRFMARVTGLRELEVFTTGATVAEHTTLNRSSRQLR